MKSTVWVVTGHGRDAKYEPREWVTCVTQREDFARALHSELTKGETVDLRTPDGVSDVRWELEEAPFVSERLIQALKGLVEGWTP